MSDITVTLRFATEIERKHFVGQLLDGWGENRARYRWADGKTPYAPGMPITVECEDEALEAQERLARALARWKP